VVPTPDTIVAYMHWQTHKRACRIYPSTMVAIV
jgi:hypothetical protein